MADHRPLIPPPAPRDNQFQVYNACNEGKIESLKSILRCLSDDRVLNLIHAKTNGATPLIMAARNGHHDVVKYLIEECKADFTQPGCVKFDGETIEGAPPLWCAAAAGHLKIVEYLVAKGADVNQTTYTNSTPLRAACFDGHNSIVEFLVKHNANIEIANRHGHTCLMIACYKGHKHIVEYLLYLKAQVNRKSIKGNTALHDSAESGSLDIMKLLLNHGAQMEKDAYGMTPLMAAAVAGYKNIIEYLVSRPSCSRGDYVDALELLGATYVDKKRDNYAAIKVWRRALQERRRTDRRPLEKPVPDTPNPAYLNMAEARCVDELEEMIVDVDEMRMQALLIRERVLGPSHPDTSYYIRYRGALYADIGNFERCITLWMYALEMQQSVSDPLAAMTMSSFLSFAELFAFMFSESGNRLGSNQIKNEFAKDILAVMEHGLREILRYLEWEEKTGKEKEAGGGGGGGGTTGSGDGGGTGNGGVTTAAVVVGGKEGAGVEGVGDKAVLNRMLVILLHLMNLMGKLPAPPSPMLERYQRLVYRLVKLDVRGVSSTSLLHMACLEDTTHIGRYPVCSFPSQTVVGLLLQVGADPNARDATRRTPLHLATKPADASFAVIIDLLLESGAHADSCSDEHVTPFDNLRKNGTLRRVCFVKNTTLKCLAARVIAHNTIPYSGVVGLDLENFIEMH